MSQTHESLLRSAEALPLVECPTCFGHGWESSMELIGVPGADPMYGGCPDCKDGTARPPLATASIAAVGIWHQHWPRSTEAVSMTRTIIICECGATHEGGAGDHAWLAPSGYVARPHPEPGSVEEAEALGRLRYLVLPVVYEMRLLLPYRVALLDLEVALAMPGSDYKPDYQAALDAVGEALAAVTA